MVPTPDLWSHEESLKRATGKGSKEARHFCELGLAQIAPVLFVEDMPHRILYDLFAEK